MSATERIGGNGKDAALSPDAFRKHMAEIDDWEKSRKKPVPVAHRTDADEDALTRAMALLYEQEERESDRRLTAEASRIVETSQQLFDPGRDRVRFEELMNPPEPRRFIVDGILPQDAGTLTGPGGGNKTTLALYEAIHVILGRPLYGREITKPGPVGMFSQEDERAKLIWRAKQIVDALGLIQDACEHVAANLYIPDFSRTRVRLVEADARGNLTHTTIADMIADVYGKIKPSLLTFDPLIFFGPGERHMNDGGAELMLAGRKIAHTLGCCVQFIAHTSMATARSKQDDQYSSRSAAALSDNGRFGRNLWTFADGDRERFGDPPASITAEEIAQRRVLVLTQPKLSDGPPVTEPVWILRDGWRFKHVPTDHRDADAIERADAERLQQFLRDQKAVAHTPRSIQDCHEQVGISRNRLRTFLPIAEARGWIAQVELPRGHNLRRGGRTHRLLPGVKP